MKKEKNNGYTLVELLAIVLVLSLIIGIVVNVALKVIDNSKEKSYQITVNSIESYADSYLLENSNRLFYVTKKDDVEEGTQENEDDPNVENVVNKEYQCITVQDLIETGYFDNSVLESNVSKNRKVLEEDYVYVERNADNKSIIKTKYLVDENEIISLCDFAVQATGDVFISYSPISWSDYKEVTISYRVKNYFNIADYSYHYDFDGGDVEVVSDFGDKKILKVTDNGKITGWIKGKDKDGDDVASAEKIIDTIDKVPPDIIAKDIVKIYGSKFNLFDGVTITDNSGLETYDKVYYNGVEITTSEGLSLGENVLSYISTDKFGNVSEEVSRIVTLVVPDKEFNYLEEDQIYPVLATGKYIIEAYGAQGGNKGGNGGYVKVEAELTAGQEIIVNTGGVNGYNGGGGYGVSDINPGGGATTIRLDGDYIVIAAGGGAKGPSGSGGAGGNGNANGGSSAGRSGTNGGGGSSGKNTSKEKVGSKCTACCYCGYDCNCWPTTYKNFTYTETVKGTSGNGGKNSVSSSVTLISNEFGKRSENGYAKISYVLEE